MTISESFHVRGKVRMGGSVIVFCLFLLVFTLAACNAPGTSEASDAPSQMVDASATALQLSATVSSDRLLTEEPGSTTQLERAILPDLGVAPELTNTIWLNTDQALRLADLGGKVILLDMWTFG